MKVNKKALELIDKGLSSKTVSKLTESQIDTLHKKLFVEQTMVSKTDSATITKLKQEKKPFQVYEKELDEEEEVTVDPNKETETQDPHQVGPSSDDGFGDETDGMGMFEGDIKEKFESKKQQKYFFARCNDEKLNQKERNKWCKMADEFAKSTKNFSKLPEKKTETKEDFGMDNYNKKVMSTVAGNYKENLGKSLNPTFEQKLEESIIKMVEKHITPKMSKKDFIKTIMEAEKEIETPVKPDVDTPSRPKPATPYKPKYEPAPKAKIPDWLSFNKIGINLK